MGQYDKYICTTLEKRHLLPGPTPGQRARLTAMGKRLPMEPVHWIDADVIPGAYYGETVWMWPPDYPNQMTWEQLGAAGFSTPTMFPHSHGFPELLSWWGANPDDAADIDVMDIQIGDEIIPLPSSWVAYVPADLPHMPIFRTGMVRQMFFRPTLHWTSGPGGAYSREADEQTKQAEEKQAQPTARQVDPSESKYARYVVFGTDPGIRRPDYMRPLDPEITRPMAYIDETVIPDAEFGCDTRWLLPGDTSKAGQVIMDAHTLAHGTSIGCIAFNYDDITDLCAEVELWIGGEKHVISKGFWAYIPPNVSQGPMIVRSVTKPVALIMSWPIGEGIAKYPGGAPRFDSPCPKC
ncbi:MAG TPA: hypothetical protein VJP78_03530 [Thermoleophilia bacterium]|nr:hypothetical protein [Thermoleophilia bacterium]